MCRCDADAGARAVSDADANVDFHVDASAAADADAVAKVAANNETAHGAAAGDAVDAAARAATHLLLLARLTFQPLFATTAAAAVNNCWPQLLLLLVKLNCCMSY